MANSLCRFITIETVDEFYNKTFQDASGQNYRYNKNVTGYYDKLYLLGNFDGTEITPNIYDTDIVFIKDIHTIWSLGEFWIPNRLTSVETSLTTMKTDISNNATDISDMLKDLHDLNTSITNIQSKLSTTKTITFTAPYDLLGVGYRYFSILPSTSLYKEKYTSNVIFVRMIVRQGNRFGMLLQDTLWKCILKREPGEYNDDVNAMIDKIYDTKLSISTAYQITPVTKQLGIFFIAPFFETDLYIQITGPSWLELDPDEDEENYLHNNEYPQSIYEKLNISEE